MIASVSRVNLRVADAPAEWTETLRLLPAATAFHEYDWITLHAAMSGWSFHPLIAWQHGRRIGIVPVLTRGRLVRTGPWVPFQGLGPLVPEAAFAESVQALRRWQLRNRVIETRMSFALAPADEALPILGSMGFFTRAYPTYVVETAGASEEVLWRGLNRNAQRAVRAAERNEISVRPSKPGELADLLPRVLSEAHASRNATNPYPKDLGERLEAWSAGRRDVHAVTTVVGDNAAGVLVTLGGHRVAVSWAGGCLREFRNVNANTVQHYAMLRWAVEQGLDAVDLGGSVDDGVARFKLSLGAKERTYIDARVPAPFAGPVLRLARQARSHR